MGCWEETCTITLQPIYSGQEAVAIILNQDLSRDDILYSRYFRVSEVSHFRVFNRVIKGKYNDYGWIKGVKKDPKDPDAYQKTIFFHKDSWEMALNYKWEEYDTYKIFVDRLEEDLKREMLDDWKIFFQSAYDYDMTKIAEKPFVQFAKALMSAEKRIKKKKKLKSELLVNVHPEDLIDIYKVMYFCEALRRDPLGSHKHRGKQDGLGENDKAREKIFKLQRKQQDALYKLQKEWE